MSESSVPRQNRPQRRRPVDGDEPLSEPAWLRPTLLFLLGLLIATLVIAGTGRSQAADGIPPTAMPPPQAT